MTNVYVDSHLDEVSPDVSDAFIGYHINVKICLHFDAVDVPGFKSLVKYLDAQYRQARNG